jgi:hypothetical protein
MRDFFDQVRRAADTNLYFLSLAGGLVIPDICGALEASDGRATRRSYVKWFDAHVAHKYRVGTSGRASFTGEDCYGLRCSLLHQGTLQPHRGGYSRVLFLEPQDNGATGRHRLHNNVMEDALNIDVRTFVSEMVTSALRWLESVEGTALYETNAAKFMRRYPNGLAPYIGGVPLIA